MLNKKYKGVLRVTVTELVRNAKKKEDPRFKGLPIEAALRYGYLPQFSPWHPYLSLGDVPVGKLIQYEPERLRRNGRFLGTKGAALLRQLINEAGFKW